MRAEVLRRVLDAGKVGRGARVFVRHAGGWYYGDVQCSDAGMVLQLAGGLHDARLIELGYLVPVAGDVVRCGNCKVEFVGGDYLAMHRRRRHDPRKPPETVIRDAQPGELAAAMVARDQRALELGSAPAEEAEPDDPLRKRNELRERERKA